MKLGFLTGALGNLSLKEKIDWASDNGFQCIEVSCWPKVNDRDYSACDIDLAKLNREEADDLLDYLKEKNISISALAYYDNNLHEDLKIREGFLNHLKKVIDAAELLGVEFVGTFVGRNREKSIEDNFEEFQIVFKEILEYAKDRNVKIIIENCPMPVWSPDGLAGTISYSPELWKEMFRLLPYDNFGLNFDPSHLVWLEVDYIKALKDFKNRIFHVHAKDTFVDLDERKYFTIFGKQLNRKDGFDLGWVKAKIPGKGQIDWEEFIEALKEISYDGTVSIEHEDPDYEGTIDKCKEGIVFSKNYLKKYIK